MYVIIIKPQHIIINVCPLIWLDQAGVITITHSISYSLELSELMHSQKYNY